MITTRTHSIGFRMTFVVVAATVESITGNKSDLDRLWLVPNIAK